MKDSGKALPFSDDVLEDSRSETESCRQVLSHGHGIAGFRKRVPG